MNLHVLPVRTGGAAENMALDFLLLQRYPEPGTPRFRHYAWRAPAFTFGYAQKIAFVRAQLPANDRVELCRRPTGGGIVDHREDWTYAVVIPRGHPLEEMPASHSYRAVHEALAEALRLQGVGAVTKSAGADSGEGPGGVCFQRAEIYDVVDESSGAKIAGAAQKRNKHGLLFQGSLWKPAAATDGAMDWPRFHDDFAGGVARALAVESATTPWPELAEDEVSALTEQYASPEWLEYR
jgi:lipoyl(octanoyl) transferase